ncbi:hypothetical protein B0H14DRAFT_2603783 [Mycena olivaceomarginata]|nr:hypothetical protein B0H14DRAFT_2603783 [Mycena olivaceomarginata]
MSEKNRKPDTPSIVSENPAHLTAFQKTQHIPIALTSARLQMPAPSRSASGLSFPPPSLRAPARAHGRAGGAAGAYPGGSSVIIQGEDSTRTRNKLNDKTFLYFASEAVVLTSISQINSTYIWRKHVFNHSRWNFNQHYYQGPDTVAAEIDAPVWHAITAKSGASISAVTLPQVKNPEQRLKAKMSQPLLCKLKLVHTEPRQRMRHAERESDSRGLQATIRNTIDAIDEEIAQDLRTSAAGKCGECTETERESIPKLKTQDPVLRLSWCELADNTVEP